MFRCHPTENSVANMTTQRKLHYDLFVVVLLAAIVMLMASLATWDPADPVALANLFPASVYQHDQLVWPANPQVTNACGALGALVSDILLNSLGICAWFVVLGLVTLEIALLRQQAVMAPWLRTIGWMLSLVGLASLSSQLFPAAWFPPVVGPGGYLGALCFGLLRMQIATAGAVIVSLAITLTGLMMWSEYLIFRAGKVVFAPAVVAATSLLPFGLIHGLVTRFNNRRVAREDDPEEDGFEEEVGDDPADDAGVQPVEGTDLPRRIRIHRREDGQIETVADTAAPVVVRKRSVNDIEEPGPAVLPMLRPNLNPAALAVASATDAEAVDEEAVVEEDEEVVGDSSDDLEEPGEALAEEDSEAAPATAAPATGLHSRPHFRIPTNKVEKDQRQEVISQLNQAADAETTVDYQLPSVGLLVKSEVISFDSQQREALAKAEMLEKTCLEFGYRVKVVEIEPGPAISQYEIQLEAGLRLQKITALADDLAIALRVPSVRIVAPIPGKNTVGVEVPNETRQLVRLRDVIEQSEAKARKMKIPLFLGKDAVGAPMVVDLASMPHLLIAGRTGTGKSVCLNAIITSILMTRTPDEVRMLMIDPKMVELSGYARLPHLMHPVVTDMRKAEAILAWAVDKMEERYALLARVGVRHVTSYNQLGEEEIMERLKPEDNEARSQIPVNLPFIVIVADEMADLMMTSGKEVEQHIIRLAQKSRAVGIHLILATQKPTVDVITGLIKSNLPARIAFQVSSKMDSRVVLDAMGADKLLGNGDMLFLWPGTSTLLRGQGTYLSDEEIERVTESVSTTEQSFVHELLHIKVTKPEDQAAASGGARGVDHRDDLYNEAVEIVIREGRGSVSLLQRALRIGYGRAARLIDFMAEDGVVGEYNGSNAREVVVTLEQWRNGLSGGGNAADKDEETTIPMPGKIVPLAGPGRVSRVAASDAKAPPPPAKKKKKPEPEPEPEDEDDDEDEIMAREREEAEDGFEAAADDFEYEDVDDDGSYDEDDD